MSYGSNPPGPQTQTHAPSVYQLMNDIEQRNATITSVQTQLTTALQQVQQAGDSVNVIADLQSQVNTLTAQNGSLTSQVATLTAQNGSLTSQIATLTAQNGTLTAINDATSNQNATLVSQNATLVSQNASLVSQNANLNYTLNATPAQTAVNHVSGVEATTISGVADTSTLGGYVAAYATLAAAYDLLYFQLNATDQQTTFVPNAIPSLTSQGIDDGTDPNSLGGYVEAYSTILFKYNALYYQTHHPLG